MFVYELEKGFADLKRRERMEQDSELQHSRESLCPKRPKMEKTWFVIHP